MIEDLLLKLFSQLKQLRMLRQLWYVIKLSIQLKVIRGKAKEKAMLSLKALTSFILQDIEDIFTQIGGLEILPFVLSNSKMLLFRKCGNEDSLKFQPNVQLKHTADYISAKSQLNNRTITCYNSEELNRNAGNRTKSDHANSGNDEECDGSSRVSSEGTTHASTTPEVHQDTSNLPCDISTTVQNEPPKDNNHKSKCTILRAVDRSALPKLDTPEHVDRKKSFPEEVDEAVSRDQPSTEDYSQMHWNEPSTDISVVCQTKHSKKNSATADQNECSKKPSVLTEPSEQDRKDAGPSWRTSNYNYYDGNVTSSTSCKSIVQTCNFVAPAFPAMFRGTGRPAILARSCQRLHRSSTYPPAGMLESRKNRLPTVRIYSIPPNVVPRDERYPLTASLQPPPAPRDYITPDINFGLSVHSSTGRPAFYSTNQIHENYQTLPESSSDTLNQEKLLSECSEGRNLAVPFKEMTFDDASSVYSSSGYIPSNGTQSDGANSYGSRFDESRYAETRPKQYGYGGTRPKQYGSGRDQLKRTLSFGAWHKETGSGGTEPEQSCSDEAVWNKPHIMLELAIFMEIFMQVLQEISFFELTLENAATEDEGSMDSTSEVRVSKTTRQEVISESQQPENSSSKVTQNESTSSNDTESHTASSRDFGTKGTTSAEESQPGSILSEISGNEGTNTEDSEIESTHTEDSEPDSTSTENSESSTSAEDTGNENTPPKDSETNNAALGGIGGAGSDSTQSKGTLVEDTR